MRALLVGVGRATPDPRFVFQTFLAIWFIGIFLALSWAGEKMPWLVVHIALPGTLLAAALLGETWERWRPVSSCAGGVVRAPGWAAAQWALFASLVALATCWFLVAAPMTYGEFVTAPVTGGWERALTSWAQERWWLLAIPPLAGVVGVGVLWLRRGARRAAESRF